MNVYGELTRAQIENLTSDPSLAAVTKGRLWMRTDLSTLKVDLGGSADTLAMLAAAQTFTNKIFGDGINFTQIATPSSPSSGFNKIYPKSDGNFYTLNSSGIEAQLGSGGGGGVKNYLGNVNNVNGNGSFELGSTSGWSLAHSSLSSLTPTSVASAGTPFDSTHGGTAATALAINVLSTAALTPTATWVSGNPFITVSSATGIVNGQLVTNPGSGTGFPASPVFVTNVSGTSVYLNKAVTGSQAGASNMLFSATPLAGVYSLAMGTNSQTAAVSSTAGDLLISQAFTIDAEDASKMLTGRFYYQNQAGTTPQFTGGPTNTFAVWIYDVTNAAWIQPAGVYNLAQGTGVGICTFTFQSTSNSTRYQVALLNQLGLVGVSYSLYLDDMSLSPTVQPQGYAGDDWVAYTPTFTGFGTVTNVSFFSRRVGDSLEIVGKATTGTATSTEARISIGYGGANSNVTIDGTKNPSIRIIGGWGLGTTSSTVVKVTLAEPSVSYLTFGFNITTTAELTKIQGTSFGNTTDFAINAKIPIAGWSSNTVFSNDTDTREVSMIALKNGGAIVTGTAVPSWTTIVKDTHGQFNLTTGVYTIPVTGRYQITYTQGGSAVTANPMIFKNSTNTIIGPAGGRTLITDLVDCVAGDTLSVQTSVNSTLTGDTTSTRLIISRVSGPASIAVSETVAAFYQDNSGSSIPSSFGTYTYGTKINDTHSMYSGGIYTIPLTGTYSFSAGISTGGVALTTAQNVQIKINKNAGTGLARGLTWGNGGTNGFQAQASVVGVKCIAGDTIRIDVQCSSATTQGNGAEFNWFSLVRTGP